jgi:hypothetical protein
MMQIKRCWNFISVRVTLNFEKEFFQFSRSLEFRLLLDEKRTRDRYKARVKKAGGIKI